MFIASLFFYIFSAITIASAFMVIASRNPVHSVLFLILAFFNSAGLFLLAGAEFLAFILLIVYVGAVAVLFLFVVMMLDIDFTQWRDGVLHYLPVGALIGIILLLELIVGISVSVFDIGSLPLSQPTEPIPDLSLVSNIEAIGNVLYTRYIFFFQLAGMILLVAMIGAIVLTLHHKPNVRRQNVSDQVSRDGKKSVKLVSAKSGEGL